MSSGLSLSEFLLWTSFAKYLLARCNILTALAKLDISRVSQSRFQAPLAALAECCALWALHNLCLVFARDHFRLEKIFCLWAQNFKQLLSQQIENILLKKFPNLLMQLYTNTSDTLNMELLRFTRKLNWFRLYWKMFRIVTTNNTKNGR